MSSLIAVATSPLHIPLKMVAGSAITLQWLRCLITHARTTVITHDDDADIWYICVEGQTPIAGTLVHAGYRSALVVVLALQTEHSECYRLAVWRDQLPATAFSYLHHQLQFNTATRKPVSWLSITRKLLRRPRGKLVQ